MSVDIQNFTVSQAPPLGWVEVTKKYKPMSREKAHILQRQLDIIGLAPFLLSEKSITLQNLGWRFHEVLKGDVGVIPIAPIGYQIEIFPLNNKWNDSVIFKKRI